MKKLSKKQIQKIAAEPQVGGTDIMELFDVGDFKIRAWINSDGPNGTFSIAKFDVFLDHNNITATLFDWRIEKLKAEVRAQIDENDVYYLERIMMAPDVTDYETLEAHEKAFEQLSKKEQQRIFKQNARASSVRSAA